MEKTQDEEQRKEFARIFGWHEKQFNYPYNDKEELKTPTWAEIFCEVGKLLGFKSNVNVEDRLDQLQVQISALKFEK